MFDMNRRIEFVRGEYFRLVVTLDQYSRFAVPAVFGLALLLKIYWLTIGGPGGDLVHSDIPKSLMLMNGQNPYSTMPSDAPYPPFLLVVDGAIIRATGAVNIAVIAWNLRVAAIVAELATGLLIYLTLRARNVPIIGILVSTSIFLIDPTISSMNYMFFHSDVFGILFLAGSLFFLVRERFPLGFLFLGLATIFKVHPLISVLLLCLWFVRRNGTMMALPQLLPLGTIIFMGLVLPFSIPGYSQAFLGFNLQHGDDGGNFTMMNFFYGFLPSILNVSFSKAFVNSVWITATMTGLALAAGYVWWNARTMNSVQVVLLGFIVWLLPLRELYPAYLVWMIVPLLIIGRSTVNILVAVLFQLGTLMTLWVWNIEPSPFSLITGAIGHFMAGLVFASCSAIGLFCVLKKPQNPSFPKHCLLNTITSMSP